MFFVYLIACDNSPYRHVSVAGVFYSYHPASMRSSYKGGSFYFISSRLASLIVLFCRFWSFLLVVAPLKKIWDTRWMMNHERLSDTTHERAKSRASANNIFNSKNPAKFNSPIHFVGQFPRMPKRSQGNLISILVTFIIVWFHLPDCFFIFQNPGSRSHCRCRWKSRYRWVNIDFAAYERLNNAD